MQTNIRWSWRNRGIILAVIAAIIGTAVILYFALNRVESAQEQQSVADATNPIIWADVPDPSVIRVGEDYYMSSTTMHMMPGTPIMRSTDLVNWEIIGYPYDRLEENDTYALRNEQHAYGQGSWASSLNYHDGVFYVLFSALDTGKTYLFSTTDPEGRWKRTEFQIYMHDPSLLFDDDGRGYIIHGRTDLMITELSSDYRTIQPGGLNETIIHSGKEGMEGAHVYKLDGRYYITTIWWEEGGIRRQYIYRADQIDGPYEERLVLNDTMGYKNNGVAQGGLVDTPDGDWYAMLFQDHDAVGRIPVLVPVRWEDGWPIYGDEEGKVPLEFAILGNSEFVTELVRSDDFYQEGIVIVEEEPDIEESLGVEFAKNAQFTEGTANWKARDADIQIIQEQGEQIAHISNRIHTWSGIEQSFSWRLQSGKEYRAMFRIKYTDGPDTKEFILTAEKITGGETSYQNLVSGTVNRGEWQVIQGTFVIPDDPSSLNLFIETPWVEDPDGEQDLMDFYVDYVSIKENLGAPADNPESAPNGSQLGLTWQWNHNPDNSRWSLTDRRGFLRLRTASVVDNLELARNTLTQRTQGPYSSGWISLDTSRMADGDYAGLAAFQQEYGFIGVTKDEGTSYLIMGLREDEQARTELLQEHVYLKVDMDFTADRAKFYYSYDGSDWTAFGSELQMRYTLPHFMGYRFAIFNYATKQLGGYVDVDYFKFVPELTGESTPGELRATLGRDIIVLSRDSSIVYDLPILIDRFPEVEEGGELQIALSVPDSIEVLELMPHQPNLDGVSVVSQAMDNNRVEATIRPTDDAGRISYDNQDGSRQLATIRMRWKADAELATSHELSLEQFNNSYLGEVSLQMMEMKHNDKRTDTYEVSGASAKLGMLQPAEAIGKLPRNGNPLVSHKFGADPYALVYDGRVYLYMTNDSFEYDADGNIKENTYASINKLGVISSDDLVNWTDHGEIHVAGPQGAAKWATQSWAPAITHKEINGEDKFFLYFANNASNIGVLTSDSPLGPWVDPIGKPLIERSTPGVQGVHWLFDPAVLVDDDGTGYIYFGGGVPDERWERPKTSRVMQLGDDMISLVGEAVEIDAPYMFENNGIHKYDGVYYYTYCSNFYSGARPEGSPGAGEIIYMTSDNPMGPWEYGGSILKNPVHFFGVGGNNHHAIFSFQDEWYITYHAQTLSRAMIGEEKGYRSTHLNKVYMNPDGTIQDIQADYDGVPQLQPLDPYVRVEAETYAWQAGVKTAPSEDGSTNRVLTDIQSGDWIALSNVDFGSESAAATFTASFARVAADSFIELRLGSIDGEVIGTLPISPSDVRADRTELSTEIAAVQGVHDLYLVFAGPLDVDLFDMDYWKLTK